MDQQYEISLVRSDRKTISMRVKGPGQVEVRAPRAMPRAQIDQFIQSHRNWLQKHLAGAAARKEQSAPPFTDQEIRALADQALKTLPARAAYFARRIGVTYGRITIRNQKSKWGSCSSQGNLNFNCLLMLCPAQVQDYVVIHELCHRREMNHSPRFWAEVESVMPDYAQWRKWLKTEGQKLIERLG